MKITLKRRWFSDKSTIGELLIDLSFICYTLEDVARPNGVKVPGKTCIQPGDYQITIDQSTRFKRLMPHILNVPMFSGIRIHAGNTAVDTEGCILVGLEYIPNTVIRSKDAFDIVFDKLKVAFDCGNPITIAIMNEP